MAVALLQSASMATNGNFSADFTRLYSTLTKTMAFGLAALNGNEWQSHSCRVLQWQRMAIFSADFTRLYLTLLDLNKNCGNE